MTELEAAIAAGGKPSEQAPQTDLQKAMAAGGKPAPSPSEPPGRGQSFARGGLQGATLGWGDEIAAGIDTAISKFPWIRNIAQLAHEEKFPALTNPDVTLAERRDAYRTANAAAKNANPLSYAGGLGTGIVANTYATRGIGPGGIAGAAATGAVSGGLAGLGNAEGDFNTQLHEALKGALIGGVTGGTLQALGRGTTVTSAAPESQTAFSFAPSSSSPAFSVTGPVPAAVQGAAKALGHGGPIAGMIGLATHGLTPTTALELAAPAAQKMTEKGFQLLGQVVMAARNGNGAAQAMLKTLAATPDGAAKIAAVINSQGGL